MAACQLQALSVLQTFVHPTDQSRLGLHSTLQRRSSGKLQACGHSPHVLSSKHSLCPEENGASLGGFVKREACTKELCSITGAYDRREGVRAMAKGRRRKGAGGGRVQVQPVAVESKAPAKPETTDGAAAAEAGSAWKGPDRIAAIPSKREVSEDRIAAANLEVCHESPCRVRRVRGSPASRGQLARAPRKREVARGRMVTAKVQVCKESLCRIQKPRCTLAVPARWPAHAQLARAPAFASTAARPPPRQAAASPPPPAAAPPAVVPPPAAALLPPAAVSLPAAASSPAAAAAAAAALPRAK
eukprot:jgi/Mesen1/9807/ME000007S09864